MEFDKIFAEWLFDIRHLPWTNVVKGFKHVRYFETMFDDAVDTHQLYYNTQATPNFYPFPIDYLMIQTGFLNPSLIHPAPSPARSGGDGNEIYLPLRYRQNHNSFSAILFHDIYIFYRCHHLCGGFWGSNILSAKFVASFR